MEIESIRLSRLQNETHFQFQTEFNNLIIRSTPEALGITEKYSTYLPLYLNEEEALNLILKSAETDKLSLADMVRDSTNRGMNDAVKSACNHFDANVKNAALRIKVVLNSYGNLAVRPYNQETAAISKLIKELRENYAADVAAVGLGAWLNELEANNSAFDALMNSRYTEEASKTQLRMKEVRVLVDLAYKAIVKRINSLIEVNGEEAYLYFVKELNQRIRKYTIQLAQHEGRNGGNDEPKESEK